MTSRGAGVDDEDTGGRAWKVGPYVLDERRFDMRRDGDPVPVQRHVLELLFFLVRSEGRLVTKKDLLQGPWKGIHVTGDALHRGIMLARRALAGAGDGEDPIATVRGKGFRFVGHATVHHTPPDRPPPPVAAGANDAPRLDLAPECVERGVRGPFVGRGPELARLQRLWDGARGGRGEMVLVAGPPGIGKTRLVEHFGQWAVRQGAKVVSGQAWEAGGAPPFWPWLSVIRPLLRAGDAGRGSEELAWARRDIESLLRDDAEGAASPGRGDDVRTRFRVFTAIRCLLDHAAQSTPLLVLLEDVHLADAASVLLLRFLGQELPSSLLILATLRDPTAGRDAGGGERHGLDDLLSGGADHVECLALGGLAPAEIGHLVRGVGRPLSPSALAAVHEATEGNPLLVEALARAGALSTFETATKLGALQPLPVPERIGRAIRAQLDRLPAATRELLALGAAMGRTFSAPVLAALSGLAPGEVVSTLEGALAAGLLEELSGEPGHYGFHHAVIRELLYRDLPAVERHEIHARIAAHLEASSASDHRLLDQLAHHAVAALPLGDHDKAVALCVRAGEQALRLVSYELSAEHYACAVSLLRRSAPGDVRRQREALVALGEAEALSGRPEDALRALEEAMTLARGEGDQDGFADAVLACFDLAQYAAIVRPSFHARVREALAARSGEDRRKARLLSVSASIGHFVTPYEARRSQVEEALAMARRLGDDETTRAVLRTSHFSILHPSSTRRAAALAREITQRSREQRCPVGEMEGLFWEAQHALELGDGEGFRRAMERHAQIAGEVRHPKHLWYAAHLECTRLFQGGHLDRAEASLRAAASRARPALGSTAVESTLGGQLFTLAWYAEGAARAALLQEARALGQRVLDTAPVYSVWWLVGEIIDCELAASPPPSSKIAAWLSAIPDDAHLLLCLALVAHQATRAPIEDIGPVLLLRDRLAAYSDLHVSVMTLYWGPVAFHRGRLAEALGDEDEAIACYEDALARSLGVRSRPWQELAERALSRVRHPMKPRRLH